MKGKKPREEGEEEKEKQQGQEKWSFPGNT